MSSLTRSPSEFKGPELVHYGYQRSPLRKEIQHYDDSEEIALPGVFMGPPPVPAKALKSAEGKQSPDKDRALVYPARPGDKSLLSRAARPHFRSDIGRSPPPEFDASDAIFAKLPEKIALFSPRKSGATSLKTTPCVISGRTKPASRQHIFHQKKSNTPEQKIRSSLSVALGSRPKSHTLFDGIVQRQKRIWDSDGTTLPTRSEEIERMPRSMEQVEFPVVPKGTPKRRESIEHGPLVRQGEYKPHHSMVNYYAMWRRPLGDVAIDVPEDDITPQNTLELHRMLRPGRKLWLNEPVYEGRSAERMHLEVTGQLWKQLR